jgi:transcriptional regulator with XRE-family HTH domain
VELDPEQLSQELVRALRGKRSQTAFGRRLGYRSNVVYTWESGRRWPDASTFLRAAGRVGLDVAGALRAFYRGEPPWLASHDPASPEGVAALLADLRGSVPLGEVALRAGRSRFAVSRWLSGKAEPRLPDLLRMIEATSLRLLDFVAALVDVTQLPSAAGPWARLEAARTMAWASPWAQAVLLGLELREYRRRPHDDAWLGAQLGLSAEEVQRALEHLSAAGQVRRERGWYHRIEVRAVDVRRSGTALKEFWSEVALARLRAGDAGTFSYNVFTVSEVDLHRLDEMQRAHYRAVRALVAESGPAERVVLLNLQLVPLGPGLTGG